MNPFNDKMPTNDTTAVQKIPDFDSSRNLSKFASENFEEIDTKRAAREGTKLIYPQKNKTGTNTIEITVKETTVNDLSENQKPAETNKKNHQAIVDTNRNACNALGHASGEGIEYLQGIEDVEIPEEEEVDEIIVPDEAEAEDLTDDKDNEDAINKSPQDEEELISKDSATDDNEIETCLPAEEEVSKSSDSDKQSSNNDIAQEENSTKDYDDDVVIQNSPIEPELIAIEEGSKDAENPLVERTSNKLHLDEDTASETTMTHDPLNYTDNKESQPDTVGLTSRNAVNENSGESQWLENDRSVRACDEDDDDVQFVETRNSPICIESDDEDGNSKENSAAESKGPSPVNNALTLPKNIIVTRTSARKSTAKPQQNQLPGKKTPTAIVTLPQIQNKSNNNSNAKHLQKSTNFNKQLSFDRSSQQIVDCIELLDSSDEESPNSRNRPTQAPKTPQKRTLLAAKGNYYKTNNSNKVTNAAANSSRLPNNLPPHVRQQPKKPAPPPLPPPTPQSHFLNAVQLQPAAVTGANPPAFSARLSNKNVIIPNAFYGNPPIVTATPEIELERRYARWLENFINQFCKPQFVATHSCQVFLQRALKYKDFVRIKALRASMNTHAHNQGASNEINSQLMADLRTILLRNTKKPSYFGRRFCELACLAIPGKSVALMAHAISGKVTLKTCSMDIPKSTNTSVACTSSSSSYAATNSSTRKRQLEEDEDDEYTPDKSKFKKPKPPSENGEEESGETGDDRKRSLRTKRTRRLDNSFSYNEDDLLAEYEIDDEEDQKLAQVEIQRKIEQKRLEAQKQRQQQVKSFESAFIQAFAKSIDGPTTSAKPAKKNESAQRIRLNNTATATVTNIRQYTANNDAEDLLQATWIENIENDGSHVVISDDDDHVEEPKEHRIYKQQPQQPQQPQTNSSSKTIVRSNTRSQEIITGDDNYDESSPANIDPLYWPKNVDSQMYVSGKPKDRCVICNLSCQRLVHHYVNEHRGCEVYNSRLSLTQIKLLKQANSTLAKVSLYKNGQFQYEAFCIFCQKRSRFLLPYWYHHFSMHTGEYAYRCIGCGIRKPTRSLLSQHQAQGCPEKLSGIAQDYAHDSKTTQIEAKICNLCNYIQLHRINIVKHLHTQHFIKQILPKHIQTIVLLKTPADVSATATTTTMSYRPPTNQYNKRSKNNNGDNDANANPDAEDDTYIIYDDEDEEVTFEEITPDQPQQRSQQQETNDPNNYYNYIPPYMQAAVNAGNFTYDDIDNDDDLSFMICGMLDVQMNTEAN